MKIALIEPFFSGSHKRWALHLQKFSAHEIRIFSLKGRHWKWRMVGGALPLADQLLKANYAPDLILCSDILDLPTFLAFLKTQTPLPQTAVYFHENQITYPWSPTDQDIQLDRNHHYGYINFLSALVADVIYFNSSFHQESFLKALPSFLKQFPDQKQLDKVTLIQQKSRVLELGCHLKAFDQVIPPEKSQYPTILWNHRWEYDKDPETFFRLLFQLKAEGLSFRLIVLGEVFKNAPPIFEEAKKTLAEEIIHFGYAPTRETYAKLLWQADLLPVTSRQEFFGMSVVEAIYCNCYPLLPDRLSYPQHIPASLHNVHLYHNQQDLYQKLKAAIVDIHSIRNNNQYRNFVARYDWSNLAPIYDAQFSANVKKGG